MGWDPDHRYVCQRADERDPRQGLRMHAVSGPEGECQLMEARRRYGRTPNVRLLATHSAEEHGQNHRPSKRKCQSRCAHAVFPD
jgi:hypothetical protein